MRVRAVQVRYVQRYAGVHCKRLEPLPNELGVHLADLLGGKRDVPNKKRAAGDVDRNTRQRLVHRQVSVRIAHNTGPVPERLANSLAKHDTAVLGRVVKIDVKIAPGFQIDIDEPVARNLDQHMIEKADPGRDLVPPRPVQINGCGDTCLTRLPFDARSSGQTRILFLAPLAAGRRREALPFARSPYQSRTPRDGHRRSQERLAASAGVPQMKSMQTPSQSASFPNWHATTIVTVRKAGHVVIAGDGQVSLGQTVIKANARKVRRLGKGNVIAGFAGATADAFTLFERLENKLEQHPEQLTRAAVELAKDWRTDRFLRRLEAMMIVADATDTLVLTGTGDVLEPEDHCTAIGSGGNYALAAARALLETDHDAEEIARRAMKIAAEICVYTNDNLVVERLDSRS